MCINKLGIALDGYGDGAVLLFRGTEMKHYISQWSGNYRYAFDHTTHRSVENAVREHEETGRWAPEKDPATSQATQGSKGAKKSKSRDSEDDEKPDGGDAPAKPQRKTKKRPRDDEKEDEPSGEPAPKKSKATLPVNRKRQARTKK